MMNPLIGIPGMFELSDPVMRIPDNAVEVKNIYSFPTNNYEIMDLKGFLAGKDVVVEELFQDKINSTYNLAATIEERFTVIGTARAKTQQDQLLIIEAGGFDECEYVKFFVSEDHKSAFAKKHEPRDSLRFALAQIPIEMKAIVLVPASCEFITGYAIAERMKLSAQRELPSKRLKVVCDKLAAAVITEISPRISKVVLRLIKALLAGHDSPILWGTFDGTVQDSQPFQQQNLELRSLLKHQSSQTWEKDITKNLLRRADLVVSHDLDK